MRAKRILGLLPLLLYATAAQAAPQIIIYQPIVTQPQLALVATSPQANAELVAPPDAVALTFSTPLLLQGSSVIVHDPFGNVLPTGGMALKDNVLSVGFPQLSKGYTGAYRVEWTAACACTGSQLQLQGGNSQPLQGSFYFSIR